MRALDLRFDSILPSQIGKYDGDLVFTTIKEAPEDAEIPILTDDISIKNLAVLRGKILEKLDEARLEDELIIGIDPGKRTGFSANFLGSEIANSLYMTIDKLIDDIISILSQLRAKKRMIKIGNGNMELTNKITNLLNLRYCSNFDIEIVNEARTTMKIKHFNQRGKRDMLSARYISKRTGHVSSVLPLSRVG